MSINVKPPQPALVKAVKVINTTKHAFEILFAYDPATQTMQVKINPPRTTDGVIIEPWHDHDGLPLIGRNGN